MKKLLIVLYGICAYTIFLVTFIYAIGFVGNFIVPKSIDSGGEGSLINSIVTNVLLLSVFAIQHSVMARPAFKEWWVRIIGKKLERSTYVLLSSLALILLYWKWMPMTQEVWNVTNEMAATLLIVLFFVGWVVVLLSTFMINHFELFGLKQVFENLRNKHPKTTAFQVNYFYKIVRHPIMLGFLIAFWATPVMTYGHLLFTATTTLYILIAVKFLEEKDLLKSLGKNYEDYQKKVPMIIPFTKNKTGTRIPELESIRNNSK